MLIYCAILLLLFHLLLVINILPSSAHLWYGSLECATAFSQNSVPSVLCPSAHHWFVLACSFGWGTDCTAPTFPRRCDSQTLSDRRYTCWCWPRGEWRLVGSSLCSLRCIPSPTGSPSLPSYMGLSPLICACLVCCNHKHQFSTVIINMTAIKDRLQTWITNTDKSQFCANRWFILSMPFKWYLKCLA